MPNAWSFNATENGSVVKFESPMLDVSIGSIGASVFELTATVFRAGLFFWNAAAICWTSFCRSAFNFEVRSAIAELSCRSKATKAEGLIFDSVSNAN